MIIDCQKIEVIMILGNIRSLMVNIWNSLPNAVVDVDSVDLFKSRLDNFCMSKDVKYDQAYTVNLAGTGDQWEYDSETF